MSGSTWWWAIAVAVVVAVVAGLAWSRGRGRRDASRASSTPASSSPPFVPPADVPGPEVCEPPVAAVEVAPAKAAEPPLRTEPRPRASPPAPPPKPYEPVTVTVVPTPARAPVAVVERVLAVAPVSADAWAAAAPLALSPVQATALAMLVAPAATGPGPVGVTFAAGSAMRLARGESGVAQSLASAGAGAVASDAWLDSVAASTLAANVLAALAGGGDLGALGDECRDLKTAVAALPAKPVGRAEPRLKPILQDASRFAREARDNYPSVIGKAAFRERIGTAFAAALDLCRDQIEQAESLRAPAEPLLRAPRFGEVQVEGALALWRATAEQRRVLELSARVLAVLHLLRAAVGDGPAPGEGDAVGSAATSLRATAAHDAESAARFQAREADAKGDPYVGRGEFEANRGALRKLLGAPWRADLDAAAARLSKAAGARSPDCDGLVCLAVAGNACEVRLPEA